MDKRLENKINPRIDEKDIIPSQSLEGRMPIRGHIISVGITTDPNKDSSSKYRLGLSGLPYFIESIELAESDFERLKKAYKAKSESQLKTRKAIIIYEVKRGIYVPTGLIPVP